MQPAMTLRLNAAQAEALRGIAQAEERTITAVVSRALREYARQNGYDWPGLAPEPEAQ